MRKHRILIVEDESVAALELKEFLEGKGFITGEPADSANKAIDEVVKNRIDLILMDINLKSFIDGIDTAQRVQIMKPIPVIYLTAYPESAIKTRAMKTKPVAYLEKPVDMDELLRIIQKTLN